MITFIRLAIFLGVILLGCYIWIQVFRCANKWVFDIETKF